MVIISVTYVDGGYYHLIMITIVTGTSIKLEYFSDNNAWVISNISYQSLY
jgi:hypothetical protein